MVVDRSKGRPPVVVAFPYASKAATDLTLEEALAEIGACRGRRRVLRCLYSRLAGLGRKASTSEDRTLTRRCQRCKRGDLEYRDSGSACLP